MYKSQKQQQKRLLNLGLLLLLLLLIIGFVLVAKSAIEKKHQHNNNQPAHSTAETTPILDYIYDSLQKSLPDNIALQVALGIPFDNDTSDDHLIFRKQYVLNYDQSKGVATWVAWKLSSDDFGSSGRYKGRFITENSLPKGASIITHDHYTNSGFDRGHIVRSHERSSSETDNRATFILSNILPQTPDLNRGLWLNFERFCEHLVLKENMALYLVAGGFSYSGNTLRNEGLVAIPDSFFKVVLAFPSTQSPTTHNTRVFAVKMPNTSGIRKAQWTDYACTIQSIEHTTQLSFFGAMTDTFLNEIKLQAYNPKRPLN